MLPFRWFGYLWHLKCFNKATLLHLHLRINIRTGSGTGAIHPYSLHDQAKTLKRATLTFTICQDMVGEIRSSIVDEIGIRFYIRRSVCQDMTRNGGNGKQSLLEMWEWSNQVSFFVAIEDSPLIIIGLSFSLEISQQQLFYICRFILSDQLVKSIRSVLRLKVSKVCIEICPSAGSSSKSHAMRIRWLFQLMSSYLFLVQ